MLLEMKCYHGQYYQNRQPRKLIHQVIIVDACIDIGIFQELVVSETKVQL